MSNNRDVRDRSPRDARSEARQKERVGTAWATEPNSPRALSIATLVVGGSMAVTLLIIGIFLSGVLDPPPPPPLSPPTATPLADPPDEPAGDGTGGPGFDLPDEPVVGEYGRGVVAMARRPNVPNSAGSQFFIVLEDEARPALDAAGDYQIFGNVVEGMEVVDEIAAQPTSGDRPLDPVEMISVTIE